MSGDNAELTKIEETLDAFTEEKSKAISKVLDLFKDEANTKDDAHTIISGIQFLIMQNGYNCSMGGDAYSEQS